MKKYISFLLALLVLLSACGTPSATETTTASVSAGNPDCHKDEDDNGICDVCYESVIVAVDFYAINDIHGKFKDSSSQPGVDELTTYLKNCQKTDEHTVFLASGDIWQGSSESNLTEGMIFTDWMNYLGFASMTIGNHEYDWGDDAIQKNAALAEFPILAINIYDRSTNQPLSYTKPSAFVDFGGVQIGIIGAVGDCYSSISADKSQNVYFKTGAELTALVKAESERLKEAGADVIVYSLHDGYETSKSGVTDLSSGAFASYYDTALSDGYVDLVFEAHTHQSYVLRDEYGVYHLQGGGDNKGITHAEIAVNAANGNIRTNTAEYLPASRYTSLMGDSVVEALLDKYESLISKGEEVLGKNGAYKYSDKLCQLVADLYYEAGAEKWGASYQIALAGAFLKARSPYNLSAGNVTYGQLQTIFPFDNQIVLCSIKGSDLRRVFYEDPNENYFMKYSDYGQSLWSNIDDNATYYVITDTYSSTYSYNRMTEVARYDEITFARDLLAEYIREGKMA